MRLETQVKEHRDACNKGDMWKSAVAEHQQDQQHQVDWDGTRVLDRAARPVQLKVKEALHIERTPANNSLNRDGGYKLPGCWIATMKKQGGEATALVLIAPALQPLYQAAGRASAVATPIGALAFRTSLHFYPEDD